ncbi:MAG: hypothetical protein ACI4FX_00485 [Agathobacter sp.]
MTIDESINDLLDLIQDLISNNLVIQDFFYNKEFQKITHNWNEQILSTPAFNTKTYEKIVLSICMDLFCKHQLSSYIEDDYNDQSLPSYKMVLEDFTKLYDIIHNDWYKFYSPRNNDGLPIDTRDVPKHIFQEIYQAYPFLCTKLLPLIVFIIADNFYDFVECTHTHGEQTQETVAEYFREQFFASAPSLYICSILNCKVGFYKENSQYEGGRILDRIIEHWSTHLDSHCSINNFYTESGIQFYENLRKKIRNVYKQELKKKSLSRLNMISKIEMQESKYKKENSLKNTSIPLGENFLAFINLLCNLPKSIESYCDMPVTLYSLNKITGWVSLRMTYFRLNLSIESYTSLYKLFSMPMTLNAILDWYCSVEAEDNITKTEMDEYNFYKYHRINPYQTSLDAIIHDTIILVQVIQATNHFTNWLNSSKKFEKSFFTENIKKSYKLIRSEHLDSESYLPRNWFEIDKFSNVLLGCIPSFFEESTDLFLPISEDEIYKNIEKSQIYKKDDLSKIRKIISEIKEKSFLNN